MAIIAKVIIIIGGSLVSFGLLLLVLSKLNIPIGRLPGDIIIQRNNFTIYFPLATSIILSVVLSIIFYFIWLHR